MSLLGDFNCVLDSQRDVRGPGQGGSTYHSKELSKRLRHLSLTDAWVSLHGDQFAPTRTSRTTASRIDRTYPTDFLVPLLEACTVIALPDYLKKKTDQASSGIGGLGFAEFFRRQHIRSSRFG
ncbi:hypothetical protein HPB50_008243 [Hyalomma asiaticum]|uniref:Uncharacterized protein n=1 Tax=Hyalomma asiaticum TaxID=266040 RepID=A0ACB7T609_HYAAI|nr:hypothetical protein HPB50_008243 [Hyalomma asiaticum]